MTVDDLERASKLKAASFTRYAHVASRLVWGSELDTGVEPEVTIAIPTFNRTDLLIEAVQSALAQRFDRPFEVIVIDNGSELPKQKIFLDWLSERNDPRVRYYVNDANIGLFGNWNRCIELPRTRWISILNDDDLLHPGFLAASLENLRTHPSRKGIVYQKRLRDERSTGGGRHDTRQSVVASLKKIIFRYSDFPFGERRLRPRHYFWENVTGNPVGAIFDKSCAMNIQGFWEDEYPSSDYAFNIRYCIAYEFWESARVLATIRVGENLSTKAEVLKGIIIKAVEIRRELLKGKVPQWWMRLFPLIVVRDLHAAAHFWRCSIDANEVARALGFSLPPYRPMMFAGIRRIANGSDALRRMLGIRLGNRTRA